MILGFRALCYEILNQEDRVTVYSEPITPPAETYIESLMLLSGRVWKVVRRKWIQLLVEIGMKNPRNKIRLSELYIKHYKTLMTDYLGNYLGTFCHKVNSTSQDSTVWKIHDFSLTQF